MVGECRLEESCRDDVHGMTISELNLDFMCTLVCEAEKRAFIFSMSRK